MPAISVLIPCYNVASTVDETLSSLDSQSLSDFEVVLVDDGSTDGTLDHLEQWRYRDARIKVLPLPHAGIIPALNAGLNACSSALVARLDADDRSTPGRLMSQVEMLDGNPHISVVSSLVRGFPQANLGAKFRSYINWLNSLVTDEDIKLSMFIRSPLAHPSVAYRRDWVLRVGGYQDHGWAEDYDLWMRLYLAGARFGKVPEILLEWRDHPHRLTHSDPRYSLLRDMRLKAHYLLQGPLSGHPEVVIYGEGDNSKLLGQELLRLKCPVLGCTPFPNKSKKRSELHMAFITEDDLIVRLHASRPPAVLVAEQAQRESSVILQQLEALHLHQGVDWWVVG